MMAKTRKNPTPVNIMTACEALWLAMVSPVKAKTFIAPLLGSVEGPDKAECAVYDLLWAAAAHAGMWDEIFGNDKVLKRCRILRLLGSAAADVAFLKQNGKPKNVKDLIHRVAAALPPQSYRDVREISSAAAKTMLDACNPAEDDNWIAVLMKVLAYEDDPAILAAAVRRAAELNPTVGATLLMSLLDRLAESGETGKDRPPESGEMNKIRSAAVETICVLADRMLPDARRSLAATDQLYDAWIQSRFRSARNYRLLQDAPLSKVLSLWDYGCLTAPQAIAALRGRPCNEIRKALRKLLKAQPVDVIRALMDAVASAADLPTVRVGLDVILYDKAIGKFCKERLAESYRM